MHSVISIYKCGIGPSSSHSMGPRKAAEQFKKKLVSNVDLIQVELYGSLAATGKGHLTDKAIFEVFTNYKIEFSWKPQENLPLHPNAMIFKAFTGNEQLLSWTVYSIGGGEITDGCKRALTNIDNIYEADSINSILTDCLNSGLSLIAYIIKKEKSGLLNDL